ncbi:hypothetical protein, partial [Aeromonas sp. 602293]|uniref:hypothetical protein n=1 Tax=Aeromonas sp. 602293 TaxID=2712041 RepID=UPI003BA094B8
WLQAGQSQSRVMTSEPPWQKRRVSMLVVTCWKQGAGRKTVLRGEQQWDPINDTDKVGVK